MKVAAYQAPLLPEGSMEAIGLIEQCVRECERKGVSILCCPEAILGGLADYSADPARFAIPVDALPATLAPLSSPTVTSIIGFTESGASGTLYNSAVVWRHGQISGVYRKTHPAIRRSVYSPGSEAPVFHAGGLSFGILICNDSNFPELARSIAAQGATALFIPTNNGLPEAQASLGLNAAARRTDIALAKDNRVWVIRADVAGSNGMLRSFGCSEIVDPEGRVVRQAGTEQDRERVGTSGELVSLVVVNITTKELNG